MTKKALQIQLSEVNKVCLDAGYIIQDPVVPNLRVWQAIYILSVAIYHILLHLIKENEKHE